MKSGAMAMLSLGFAPSFLTRAAEAAGSRRRLLIAIFQRGAVDGLNMIVPYGEADYYRLRPTIAIPRPGKADAAAIDLDGFFGLHPRMASLEPFWRSKSLAIVHACGSPDSTRSHFDAQDYMETATPGVKSTRDGWLNRYLQAEAGERNPPSPRSGRFATRPASAGSAVRLPGGPPRRDLAEARRAEAGPLRGVAVTRQMPRSLQGVAPALAVGRIGEFGVRGDRGMRDSFESAYESAADEILNGTAGEAFDAMRTLQRVAPRTYQPSNGASYPRSPFGQALQEIARLAKADVGLEVAFAETGQWDHHVNEGGGTGQIANRLDDFARSLAALVQDLGDRMADTVILTMSEFGRAVAENGNRGTDHGHGNAMIAIGGPVKGGIYGRWPGLAAEQRFEGRDLAVTTDFRDVFGEVVVRHLGADEQTARRVFPGYALSTARFRGVIRT